MEEIEWTDLPPEIGKRYKIIRLGSNQPPHESGVYDASDLKFWPRNLKDGYRRSVEAL